MKSLKLLKTEWCKKQWKSAKLPWHWNTKSSSSFVLLSCLIVFLLSFCPFVPLSLSPSLCLLSLVLLSFGISVFCLFWHASVSRTYPCQSVRYSVRWSVHDTFGFPFCQRLWSPYVNSWRKQTPMDCQFWVVVGYPKIGVGVRSRKIIIIYNLYI